MTKHRYPKFVASKVIGNKQNLCAALSISEAKFDEFLSRPAELRFKHKQVKKKNGVEFRDVYSPSWDLKVLLRRFNKRFFADRHVIRWPYFLYGCVRNNPEDDDGKDYIACARVHSNARSVLKIDIANFFPSITYKRVVTVFEETFHFSSELAKNLARLNCVDGNLVQGSPCASYIAGAVFGTAEGAIVARLEAKGYQYTRYVDDITISSVRRGQSFALATKLIDDLLSDYDLERNIEKTSLSRSGTTPLVVHGIKVGGGKISLLRDEFKAIRASVHALETYFSSVTFRTTMHYRRMFMRCTGLVGKLARTKDRRCKRYFEVLRKIRPVSTQEDIELCSRWVDEIERNSVKRSNYFFHLRRANKTWSRLTLLAWTFPSEALALKKRLRSHKGSYATVRI